MKTETKLLGAIGIMPVLADFLEDQNFNQQMKMVANDLIASIRRFDNYFMRDADIELIDQQVNIQLAFRQWLKLMEND
tara:strand:- start:127 stop:360 length:234 start_codon:yes stop_codon:yes gene_type:complete